MPKTPARKAAEPYLTHRTCTDRNCGGRCGDRYHARTAPLARLRRKTRGRRRG
jgi:hypothetical protein